MGPVWHAWRAPTAEHIPPCAQDDVLMEQFEYLLKYHGGPHGIETCKDCQRMAMIKCVLMKPFDDHVVTLGLKYPR